MYKRNQTRDPNTDRKDSGRDRSETERTGDTNDIREANENIRKSQTEDSGSERSFGHRPAIDRDR